MAAPKVEVNSAVRDTMKRTGMDLDELVDAIEEGGADELGIEPDVVAAIKSRAKTTKKDMKASKVRTDTTDDAAQQVNTDDNKGANTTANTQTDLTSSQGTMAAQQAMAQQQAQLQAMQQQAWAAAAAQQAATNPQPSLSQAELQSLMKDLLGNRSSGDGSRPSGSNSDDSKSTKRLETSDVDAMDPKDVAFDKYGGGAMSKEEAAQAVLDACDLNGVPDDPDIRQKWINLMVPMAIAESGLDPDAGNGWDSNAIGETQSDGLPFQSSRGMWQTIPQTFASYHVAGTSTSIYDPVASAAAAQRYMFDRYEMTPEGGNMEGFAADRGINLSTGDSSGGYKGY